MPLQSAFASSPCIYLQKDPAQANTILCRPVVKGLADHSNFDDYSSLPPLHPDFLLSETEQLMFAGI